MLTSVGRAAVRRVLTRPATTTSAVTPYFAPGALAIRLRIPSRSFTTTEAISEAAKKPAGATAKAPKATKTAAGTKLKKTASKKAVAAKKPKAKKKAVKAKPKKAVVKKVLSPEQKEAAQIKEWKKLVLPNSPKPAPQNAWGLFISQNSDGTSVGNGVAALAQKYSSLSTGEMADLKAAAEANRVANRAARITWVESHEPEVIAIANEARRRLRAKLGKPRSKNYLPIEDARLPGTVRSGYILFLQENLKGRMDLENRRELFRETAKRWSTLSPEEQKRFKDMSAAEATIVSRQRQELNVKVKALKLANKQEAAAAKKTTKRVTKAAATNDIGL